MPPPADHPVWFHLGVVAPAGFVPPGGPNRVLSRLLSLVRHREHRRERIGLVGVCGEPLTRDAAPLFAARGWHAHAVVRHPNRRHAVAHRAACAHIAAQVDALAVFHSRDLDADMRALLDWCDWLGVATRVVRIAPDPEPV